jgi:hypothetical protein
MKKLILSLLLVFGLFSFSPITPNLHSKNNVENKKSTIECKYGQCQATAKSTGLQCKHCVSEERDSYCYQHK